MPAIKQSEFNFDITKQVKTKGLSKTVPGQTKTVKQVLIDYSRGISPSVAKNPIYDTEAFDAKTSLEAMDNLPFVHVPYMDMSDIQRIMADNTGRLDSLKKELLTEIERQKAAATPAENQPAVDE